MIFNVTNDTPEFTVHDLDAGKGFLVSVFAFNPKGRSEAMTLVANTHRVAERRTGKFNNNIHIVINAAFVKLTYRYAFQICNKSQVVVGI